MTNKNLFLLILVAALAFGAYRIKSHLSRHVDAGQIQADAAVMTAASSLVSPANPHPLTPLRTPMPVPSPTPAKPDSSPPKPVPRVSWAVYGPGSTMPATIHVANEADPPPAKGAGLVVKGKQLEPCEFETERLTTARHMPWDASVIVNAGKDEPRVQGSGTAICKHTVLTCAHFIDDGFRVWVDGKLATLVDIDRAADLALLRTEHELKFVPVAKVGPRVGDAVMAWGYEWDKQGLLRGWPSKVYWLNRYQGPDNLLVSGQSPKSGRSGGGLFNASGELVGVCSANDPPDHKKPTRDGLYVGYNAVMKMIDPSYKVPAIEYAKHVTAEEAKPLIAIKSKAPAPPKAALEAKRQPAMSPVGQGATLNTPARGTTTNSNSTNQNRKGVRSSSSP